MSRDVVLPSGGTVRGRPLREVPPTPADFLLALAPGPLPPWPQRRIRWPDFWVPTDGRDAREALSEALARVYQGELVEIGCRGGVGRTGTALAALAVLDGLAPGAAVRWVRATYHPRAVETPWQAWWLRTLSPART